MLQPWISPLASFSTSQDRTWEKGREKKNLLSGADGAKGANGAGGESAGLSWLLRSSRPGSSSSLPACPSGVWLRIYSETPSTTTPFGAHVGVWASIPSGRHPVVVAWHQSLSLQRQAGQHLMINSSHNYITGSKASQLTNPQQGNPALESLFFLVSPLPISSIHQCITPKQKQSARAPHHSRTRITPNTSQVALPKSQNKKPAQTKSREIKRKARGGDIDSR